MKKIKHLTINQLLRTKKFITIKQKKCCLIHKLSSKYGSNPWNTDHRGSFDRII